MRWPSTPRSVLPMVVAATLAAIVVFVALSSASGSGERGRSAPPFDLPELDGGGRLRLEDLRGTPVLVNFWAAWCAPCRAEMPELQDLADRTDGRLTVVGVNVWDDPGQARQLVSELDVTYSVVLAEGDDIARRYDVTTVPSTALITADGRLVALASGRPSPAELEGMLANDLGIDLGERPRAGR